MAFLEFSFIYGRVFSASSSQSVVIMDVIFEVVSGILGIFGYSEQMK